MTDRTGQTPPSSYRPTGTAHRSRTRRCHPTPQPGVRDGGQRIAAPRPVGGGAVQNRHAKAVLREHEGRGSAGRSAAENEHVHFRAGAGYKHWADSNGWALGPDLLYGVDIFWGKPITTSLEATAGLLGHGWSTGARGSIGVMIGQAELYAGYDGVWIGREHQRTAFLGGPIAGFRAYF